MTKKNNQKSKTKKATQQKRFRNLMYAEAVGCLPLKWLDKRYLSEYNKDVMVLKNAMQEPLEHKDGTPVTFHPHAILDMNAVEEDLNNAFGLALERNLDFIYIGLKVEDALEIIVIPKNSMKVKQEFYNKAYTEDLQHVMNSKVEIIGIALPNKQDDVSVLNQLTELWS